MVADSREAGGQGVQDELYAFPYHYLVDFDPADRSLVYGRYYAGGLRYAAYLLWVVRQLQPLAFKSLVDIGCGEGRLTGKLAQRYPDARVLGVDISDHALRWARDLNPLPNLELRRHDIMQSPPEGAPFDAGTLVEVLEHVPPEQVEGFVRAAGALIRPGGHLVVTVPSVNLDVSRIKRHYQHFDADGLVSALAPVFEPVQVEYLNRGGRLDRWCRRALHNGFFALTDRRLVDGIFRLYLRSCLQAGPESGLRIGGVFRRG